MSIERWLLHLIYEYHGYGILLYVLIINATAGILSFCIGLERQLRGEPAGVRTHAILAMGSSLLMTISIWAIRMADGSIDIIMGTVNADLNYDTSRIAAGVVTSMGFLGGGVILREKFTVRGLSTAATLWICTAIGLACGSGFIFGAMITTVIVLVALIGLGKVIDLIDDKSPTVVIKSNTSYPVIEKVRDFSEVNGLMLKHVKIIKCDEKETISHVSFNFTTDKMMLVYLCRQMSINENIIYAKLKSRKTDGKTTRIAEREERMKNILSSTSTYSG